jgi:hypothetical protein
MESSMTKRYLRAMISYAVIAALAAFTLEGKLRIAVLLVMAALAIKTHIAYKAGW